eukprot:m.325481 g.325481  ORF g.325481 m.325481 type:complete len:69 (-) comp19734_c0_seq22:1393-1599(-)
MISALQLQLQQGQQSGGPCPRCLSREERLQHVDGSHAGNQDEVDAQSDPYPLAGPTPMWRKGGQGEPG